MIGELEVELAIADANGLAGAGELVQFMEAGIDVAPVRAYAERFHRVKDEAGAQRREAVVGAFLLAFRLGVLAARHERAEL